MHLQACNFIKKKLQHRCFLAKYLRTPILRNICEQLLLKAAGLKPATLSKRVFGTGVFLRILQLLRKCILQNTSGQPDMKLRQSYSNIRFMGMYQFGFSRLYKPDINRGLQISVDRLDFIGCSGMQTDQDQQSKMLRNIICR